MKIHLFFFSENCSEIPNSSQVIIFADRLHNAKKLTFSINSKIDLRNQESFFPVSGVVKAINNNVKLGNLKYFNLHDNTQYRKDAHSVFEEEKRKILFCS